jgi:broad specificity phosphatase PhoE
MEQGKGADYMAQRLLLICCAPTAAMRRGAFPLDEPADARFLARGADLATHLRRFDGILTSPALRARQTAVIFAPAVADEAALADQDFGDWAGVGLARLHETDPAALGAWLSDADAAPPGGESFAELCRRVDGFMRGLLGRAGETVAITHPAVIRAAIVTVLGALPACFARIDVEPLSMTEFRGEGSRWMLRSTGVTGAVPDRAQS